MSENKNTIYGFIAIALWSTAAAFTRTLSEDLGTYTAAALVYLIAGVIGVGYQYFFGGGMARFRTAPKRYWLICGFLYILYVASAYTSVSLASTREQVMVVILIKFLWPLLTLLFTIPILKTRPSRWLPVGILLSLTGIVIANLGSKVTDFSSFMANINTNIVPYVIGFVAAISWGLYSNLSRKLVGDSDGGAGIFILATGLLFGAVQFFIPSTPHWSGNTVAQLLYQSIFTAFLATLLWDAAMRKGKVVLVTIVSNFLPLITTVVSALLLGVSLGWPIWAGSILVVLGTIWSKRCFDADGAKASLEASQDTAV